MVDSIYRGQVRGLRANREYGLRRAGSQRADRRLELEQQRISQAEREARLRDERASRNERRMAQAIATRLGNGITTPPQIIKQENPFQDGTVTRLQTEEERPIIEFLGRQGKQASAVFQRGDGSLEIINPGGQSAVVPATQLVSAMKQEALATQKQEAQAKATELREKGLRLQEARLQKEQERARKKTEGMTASDARLFRTYEAEYNRLFRQWRAASDPYSGVSDETLADRLQERMDILNEQMSQLRAPYAEKAGLGGKKSAEPGSAPQSGRSVIERIKELRAIQSDQGRSPEIRDMAGRAIDELVESLGESRTAPTPQAPAATGDTKGTVLMRAPDGSEARVPKSKIAQYSRLGATIIGN